MSTRVAPSAVLEEQIGEVLSRGIDGGEQLSEIGRLGARLVLQRAIDEEVEQFLKRARYERTPEGRGSRNGQRSRRIQTAEGEITVAMPQVRGSVERFVSQVIPDSRSIIRTRPLEAPMISAYVRGLSDRDIQSLAEEAGLGPIFRSAASEVCRELRNRYKAFWARDLSRTELLVLFLDAVYLRTRPRGQKEGVLVAWGYTLSGQRELVAVCLGQRERHEDWLALGRDLTRRGLKEPWLLVSDGAPGLVKALVELWPEADRQRCTVHRLPNILAKLPQKDKALYQRVQAGYWPALDEASTPQEAEQRLRALVNELETAYPSAAACLADDLEALCVHLRYPSRLRKRLRSSNLLERSLEEVQRRVKVIGRFPGETSCLSLSWAVLDLVVASAHGLGLTVFDHQHLENLRALRLPADSLRETA
ncbi:MAG: IS256 family transposase [Chloroflexota bacterium]|nr:MAG: IS256 family transposase [Chloroflexota bacterium]